MYVSESLPFILSAGVTEKVTNVSDGNTALSKVKCMHSITSSVHISCNIRRRLSYRNENCYFISKQNT